MVTNWLSLVLIRLARSIRDLQNLVHELKQKGRHSLCN